MNSPTQVFPIHDTLDEIKDTLSRNHELILEAPPGAGKTTIVPLALLDSPWLGEQKILMLQPRRMAARAAAERMADLSDSPVGELVGYQIRQESKLSDKTRILVMTEGVLLRQLQQDPSLDGVGLVIFDEFHERSLDSDLGLALSLQGREFFRDEDNPLKLLVMSATLQGLDIAPYLNAANIIRSEGRSFPIELHYRPAAVNQDIVRHCQQQCLRALKEKDGNILVFLPGQGEIKKVQTLLQEAVPSNIGIFPLHGGLSLAEQKQAISPVTNSVYDRKVILSTDIAETSLTIEGISVVIDSGLVRVPEYHPSTGITRLNTKRISKASSVQRSGRAGRLGPGTCIRLWGESQQQGLAEHYPAQILHADLCPMALQLFHWGINSPEDITWLTAPPKGAFAQAKELLYNLGAFENGNTTEVRLSKHGQVMAQLPTHPRIAHMLLHAAAHGFSQQACQIAALLSERDTLRLGCDFSLRIDIISGQSTCPKSHKAWLKRVQAQSLTFQKLIKPFIQQQSIHADLCFPLCEAYPDRIAKWVSDNRYKLSNGRMAELPESDALTGEKWLLILDLGGINATKTDRIFSACRIDPDFFTNELQHLVEERDSYLWDEKAGRFIAEKQFMIGQLVLRTERLQNIPQEKIVNAIIAYIKASGIGLLPWTEELRQWQTRVQLAKEHDSQLSWPDISDNYLLERLDEWLAPYLTQVRTINDIANIPLRSILEGLISWPMPKILDEIVPEKIEVPSGSKIRIDYTQNPPVLAVKLQEMFGCESTPKILNNKLALMVHLLSPARRPLQITQDLKGFWATSYHEVKKEMKGRYPKHPWPDDPINTQATRSTKKKMEK